MELQPLVCSPHFQLFNSQCRDDESMQAYRFDECCFSSYFAPIQIHLFKYFAALFAYMMREVAQFASCTFFAMRNHNNLIF